MTYADALTLVKALTEDENRLLHSLLLAIMQERRSTDPGQQ